jgi:hypothetical protein
MRKIEFKASISGLTKIFVDGTELATAIDPKAFREFRLMKSKLPPVMGKNIVDAITKKLADDHVNLTAEETSHILKYVKAELNL